MPLTIIQRGDTADLHELPRHYKPVEVREMEVSTMEAFSLGVQLPSLEGRHRVMVVYGVSKVNANNMTHLAKYLGPATGKPGLSIILGEEDDWGHAQDIMESRVETIARREIESALRREALQRSINTQLPDIADDMEKKKKGLSSFGALGKLQRVS